MSSFTLLPPAPGACPICAEHHAEDVPHNRASLYWAVTRQRDGLPPPTWSDAVAHCEPRVQRTIAIYLGQCVEDGKLTADKLGPLIEELLAEGLDSASTTP